MNRNIIAYVYTHICMRTYIINMKTEGDREGTRLSGVRERKG